MYKLLLCLRYLRTRYLAFVCVVSVLLGVATLIVVNSVMSGFGNKLRASLNGLSGDMTLHTEASAGFDLPPAELEKRIVASPAGRYVKAVSPTVDFYAMLQFQLRYANGDVVPHTKMVRIVGIDPERHARVGKFADYLTLSKDDPKQCFTLSAAGQRRFDQNRMLEAWEAQKEELMRQPSPLPNPLAPPRDPGKNAFGMPVVVPPDEGKPALAAVPDLPKPPATKPPGIVLGYAIAHHKLPGKTPEEAKEITLLHPGDDVFVATIGSSGTRPVSATFVVTDYFKSEMSEYDGNVVYVPLAELQRMRAMDDQVNSFQVRLTDDVRENPAFVHEHIVPAIQDVMPRAEDKPGVRSWWQQQTSLFAAIDVERGLLNILLFLIVGVAGFGVLAIFSMIVAEKYRDIGILKSLGASGGGVMSIFLGYGLLLGLIGCGLGTALGLWITYNLNDIESFISRHTGQQIFDRKIYYFDKIPTNVDPLSLVLVNLGAVAIAVASSILPAVRAARLQPVRALRFE